MEMVMTYFKAISYCLPWETKKNYKTTNQKAESKIKLKHSADD
jgi:hypothetical protein